MLFEKEKKRRAGKDRGKGKNPFEQANARSAAEEKQEMETAKARSAFLAGDTNSNTPEQGRIEEKQCDWEN